MANNRRGSKILMVPTIHTMAHSKASGSDFLDNFKAAIEIRRKESKDL